MSAVLEQDRISWMRRVLGVELPEGLGLDPGQGDGATPSNGVAEAAQADRLIAIWQQAKDAANAQLSTLQDRLRKTHVRGLLEIADQLDQAMQGFRTGLIVALNNLSLAAPAQQAAARVRALEVVEQYRSMVEADQRLLGADNNPFGVPVAIRARLGAALDQLQSILR